MRSVGNKRQVSDSLLEASTCCVQLAGMRQLWRWFHLSCATNVETVVPSKISMFGGRLLQDRLPTRVELWSRGVIRDVHQICCVLCFDEIETTSHLFTSCSETRMILDWTYNNEYYNQYNSFFVQVKISLCGLTF